MSDNEQVVSPGFRSPYVRDKIQKGMLPLFITCKDIDFKKELDDADKKMNELATKARSATNNADRDELEEEIDEINLYKTVLNSVYNGHFRNHTLMDMFVNAENWSQALKLNDKVIGTIPKGISAKKDDEGRISGRANVIAAITKQTGIGTPVSQMLPDSMITVGIGNITDKSLVRLMMELNEIRNGYGFATKGSMYSATDVKVISTIVEFCLSHVTTSTLRETSFENLMQVMVVTDAQALAAGTLKSIYPSGYPFLYSCANTEKCTFKTYGTDEKNNTIPKLDFGRVTWFKKDRMPPARHRFLSAPMGTYTVEQVLEEQAKYNIVEEIGPFTDEATRITMEVQAPMFIDYRRIGDTWLSDIITGIDDIIKRTSQDTSISVAKRKRTEYINTMIAQLSVQKESAWIRRIIITDSEGDKTYIEGENDVLAALEPLSSKDDFSENSIRIFMRAKNRLTTSMTGIPIFECPECGTLQEDENSQIKSIIPRNVIADFFYLMELKRQAL